jgi:hypothetical protein
MGEPVQFIRQGSSLTVGPKALLGLLKPGSKSEESAKAGAAAKRESPSPPPEPEGGHAHDPEFFERDDDASSLEEATPRPSSFSDDEGDDEEVTPRQTPVPVPASKGEPGLPPPPTAGGELKSSSSPSDGDATSTPPAPPFDANATGRRASGGDGGQGQGPGTGTRRGSKVLSFSPFPVGAGAGPGGAEGQSQSFFGAGSPRAFVEAAGNPAETPITEGGGWIKPPDLVIEPPSSTRTGEDGKRESVKLAPLIRRYSQELRDVFAVTTGRLRGGNNKAIETAITKFNLKPTSGIDHLISQGIIRRTPSQVRSLPPRTDATGRRARSRIL